MHDAHAIGDLIIVGFDGYEAPDHVLERIRAGRAGGIILFDRNVHDAAQVTALTAQLQDARAVDHDTPLIVAIDQEGGTVARLRDPWAELPGNMALGAADDEALAEAAGRFLADMLLPLGITLNLAPVLDIASLPQNPGIGVRSFGADSERVAALGCALIRGMQGAGLPASAKHFPGMGDAELDAHEELPIVSTSLRDLNRYHIPPFVAAMEAGVASIMTAHCAYPGFERMTRLPATVNRRLFQQLVRREFGYEGAIISDCMEMKALTKWLTPETGSCNAVMAGVDLLLVCHTPAVQDAVYAALSDAAERGLIAEQVIADALCRQAPLRAVASPTSDSEADAAKLIDTIASRALTVVRGDAWPAEPAERITLLVPDVFQQTAVGGQALDRVEPLADVLREAGRTVAVCPLHSEVALPPSDAVIVITGNAHLRPEQLRAAQDVLARSDGQSLVLALRNPFDADAFPDHAVLLTYSDTPAALRAAGAWLLERAGAPGRCPVPLQSV